MKHAEKADAVAKCIAETAREATIGWDILCIKFRQGFKDHVISKLPPEILSLARKKGQPEKAQSFNFEEE